MKPLPKLAFIAGGYLAALVIAVVAVALHSLFVDDRLVQASSGMYAFGDLMLFLIVFCGAAIPATVAALWMLRLHPLFRKISAAIATIFTMMGCVSLLIYLGSHSSEASRWIKEWSAAAVLRIVFSPFFSGISFLFGLLTPSRSIRAVFLGCALIEALLFAAVMMVWVM